MDAEIEKDLKDRFNEAERESKLGQSARAEELFTGVVSRCENLVENHTAQETVNVRKLLALALNNRGYIRYLKVDFTDAVADYTSALGHNPVLAVAYYNRGLIHYRLGRFQTAIQDQQKALHIDPGFTSALQCLQQAQESIQNPQANNASDPNLNAPADTCDSNCNA